MNVKTFLPEEIFKIHTASGESLLVSKPSIYQRFYNNYDVFSFFGDTFIEKSFLEENFILLEGSRSISLGNRENIQVTYLYKHKEEDIIACVSDPDEDENSSRYPITSMGVKQEVSLKAIENIVSSLKNDRSLRKVYMIIYENNNFRLKSSNFKEDTFLLEGYYNKDFNEVYDHVINSIKEEDKGLYLFHGTPGTGKTTFIKHLTEKAPGKKFIFVPNNFLENLTSPSFITFLASLKNSVLILEDCEEFLKDRSISSNSIVPTLLNISDGILSDLLNIHIICTFNTDLKNIDKALLREGRLTCQYEFKKLSEDIVKEYFEKEEITASPEELSLAEMVYFKKKKFKNEKEERKIGF